MGRRTALVGRSTALAGEASHRYTHNIVLQRFSLSSMSNTPEMMAELQRRFDGSGSLSAEATTSLLSDLHRAREFAAFAFVWDVAKARGETMDAALSAQLHKAHKNRVRNTGVLLITTPSRQRSKSLERMSTDTSFLSFAKHARSYASQIPMSFLYALTRPPPQHTHNAGLVQVKALDSLVVPRDRVRVNSTRRIHKIVMGPIRGTKLKQRSDAASEYIEAAAIWYAQRAEKPNLSSRNGREKFAKLMMQSLPGNMTKQTALGVITKLKQKKLA